MTVLATIRIMEREGPEEDFITETGRGFPDDLEYHEVQVIEITDEDLLQHLRSHHVEGVGILDDMIQDELNECGLGQWDGGNVGYDPDGTRPNYNRGTRIERYASIKRTMPDDPCDCPNGPTFHQATIYCKREDTA